MTPGWCGISRLRLVAEVTHEAGMFRIRLMQACRVCAAIVARREWRGGVSDASGADYGCHVGFPTRAAAAQPAVSVQYLVFTYQNCVIISCVFWGRRGVSFAWQLPSLKNGAAF